MSILEIRDLAYDYVTKAGAVHALKHATASFEAGTVYAIVGRSGSGKSPFMSLLAGGSCITARTLRDLTATDIAGSMSEWFFSPIIFCLS